MKGIIFNLLEEVVAQEFDEHTWDAILESEGVQGAYTSIGNYPDNEFLTLIQALASRSGGDGQDLLSWFGRRAIGFLSQRYPEFFAPHTRLRPFLLTLNDVIHAEVRKLYPGVDVPVLGFDTPMGSPDAPLGIHYRSKRRLCFLAEGFILGASDYYRETVHIHQETCMLRGDEECLLLCTFRAAV